MDTLVTVYHCINDISIAIHICGGALGNCVSRSSKLIYNCLARFQRLNNDSEMLVIFIRPMGATYWHVNQKSDLQTYVTALTTLFYEEKLLVDVVRVTLIDFKIKCFLAYANLEVTPETKAVCFAVLQVLSNAINHHLPYTELEDISEMKAMSFSVLLAMDGPITIGKIESPIWKKIEMEAEKKRQKSLKKSRRQILRKQRKYEESIFSLGIL